MVDEAATDAGSHWKKRILKSWIFHATVVGVVAGCAAFLFSLSLHTILHGSLAWMALETGGGAAARPGLPWSALAIIVLLPAVGGLLSGLLCDRFAPTARGHGTDGAIDAFHRLRGRVPLSVPVVKFVSSLLTLGSGGSGGVEGPIAQVGSGFASGYARLLGLSPRRSRILLVAGMGAGIAAIFEAPLAATIFAGEILYKGPDVDGEVLVPTALASVISYAVYVWLLSMVHGVVRWSHLFRVPEWTFHGAYELLGYGLLAIACGLLARLWIRVFYAVHDGFERLPVPSWSTPGLGGFLTGLLAAMAILAGGGEIGPALLDGGYGLVQRALDGNVAVATLLLYLVLKLLATAFSIGSGGSGGVFGPSLVLGGVLGSAVGFGLHALVPALVPTPGAYGLVGMAALFGAAAHAPICSVIMVTEVTRGYGLLVPSIWTCVLAYQIVGEATLYPRQVKHIHDSPAHQVELHWDLLENLRSEDVMSREVAAIRAGENFSEIRQDLVAHRFFDKFPVLDGKGKLVGLLAIEKLRAHLSDPDLADIGVALDVMDPILQTVGPATSLADSLRILDENEWNLLCVTDPADPGRLVGVLSRRDILQAYKREILRRNRAWEEL